MCLVLRKKHFTKVWIIFVNCKLYIWGRVKAESMAESTSRVMGRVRCMMHGADLRTKPV